jgi:hypothetical protein
MKFVPVSLSNYKLYSYENVHICRREFSMSARFLFRRYSVRISVAITAILRFLMVYVGTSSQIISSTNHFHAGHCVVNIFNVS